MNGDKPKDKLYFPRALEDIMAKRNYTIREMAAILEFSPTYISDLRKGNRMPSEQVMERLKAAGPTLCLTQEELKLPEGIEHIDNIGHNNRTKAIYIPGTLTDKKLPQIYQCCKLKKLTIGEGISAISENAYYFGLNNLEFVSLPSTLNEFYLGYFDQRMILFPDGNDCKHHGYMEKLTIEKAFGKGSYFGETKIKFEIPRKNERPYFGKINIYFADDKVVINDYPVSYKELSPNGTYYVDYLNQSLKQQQDEPTIKSPPNSYSAPKLNGETELDNATINAIYLEFLLSEMKKISYGIPGNSTGAINYSDSKKGRELLKRNLDIGFDEYTQNQNINITDEQLLLAMTETLKDRGMQIEVFVIDGAIFQRYKGHSFNNHQRPSIINIYRELMIIDYIIAQLISTLDKKELINYLTKVIKENDDNPDCIKINLQNLPPEMTLYAPLIIPSALSNAISCYGIREIDETSIIEYINYLEKRFYNTGSPQK